MKKSIALRMFRSVLATLGLLAGVSFASANPVILHFSETAWPGEIVSLEGGGFGTSPQVMFHRVLSSETTLSPDSNSLPLLSSYLDPVKGNAVTVQLPKTMPMGLYAIWIKNGTTLSQPKFINRARATGFEYGEVPSGYMFRIFGRNLSFPGQTPIVTFTPVGGGKASPSATVVTTTYNGDPNILQILAPPVTAGTNYNVNVSNNMGHNSLNNDSTVAAQTIQGYATGTDVFNLNVPWGQDPIFATMANHQVDITQPPYSADKTGSTNVVNQLQQAIYDVGNYPGGGVVYLPAGTYLINYAGENTSFNGLNNKKIPLVPYEEITIPSNVVLKGDGSGLTTINDMSGPMPYPNRAMVGASTSGSHYGLENLTYQQSPTIVTAEAPGITFYGSYSFFVNVNLTFAHTDFGIPNAVGGQFSFANSTSHDVVADTVSTDFAGIAAQTGLGIQETYIIVRNCTFKHHGSCKVCRMFMGGIQNLVFENNMCERDSLWPGDHATDRAYEQGQVECDTAGYETYLGNTFYSEGGRTLDTNDNSGETIGSQGQIPFVDDTGHVTGFNATTITDSARSWPVNAMKGQVVTLTDTPVPQTGTITSNTAQTINIGSAWTNPLPSTAYTYQVYDTSNNLLYSGHPTASTASSITDSAANFSTITGTIIVTPPKTQTQTVLGNTATTLTVAGWNPLPTATTTYDLSISYYDSGKVGGLSGTNNLTVTCSTRNPNNGTTYWGGTQFINQIFAIVSGTGAGQWRKIVSNSGNQVTIDPTTPWDITPDSTSCYCITSNTADHFLIKGNTFTDQPRSISLYTGCHDTAVVDNTFKNTGQSIYLRSDQEDLNATGGWYGRINLAWDNVVTDNFAIDTTGTYPGHFAVVANSNGSVPFGTEVINSDFRRNIILTEVANPLKDAGSSLLEGYNALNYTHDYYATIPVELGTVLDDNESIATASANTLYPIYLNSDSYVTAIHSQLNTGYFTLTPKPYAENYPSALVGSPGPSIATWLSTDATCFQAGFNGPGTSTGGTTDAIDFGATGNLVTGTTSFTITSSNPMSASGGSYLECTSGPGIATTGHFQIYPTSDRTSWGRIFDFRTYEGDSTTGKWLVNGGFDFFWRPVTTPASASMHPIDLSNGTGGVRLILGNSSTGLNLQVIQNSGGGGAVIYGTFPGGFQAGTTYHIGVTFSTNPTSGLTTEKLFAVAGPGSIDTTTTGAVLLGSTTFTLSTTNVDNTTGFLSNARWDFGDDGGNGALNTNDYDALRLYSQDPGTFPGL